MAAITTASTNTAGVLPVTTGTSTSAATTVTTTPVAYGRSRGTLTGAVVAIVIVLVILIGVPLAFFLLKKHQAAADTYTDAIALVPGVNSVYDMDQSPYNQLPAAAASSGGVHGLDDSPEETEA